MEAEGSDDDRAVPDHDVLPRRGVGRIANRVMNRMKGFLDRAVIRLACRVCGHVTKRSVAWIKTNDELACACGTRIRVDADRFKKQVAEAERLKAALEHSLAATAQRGCALSRESDMRLTIS